MSRPTNEEIRNNYLSRVDGTKTIIEIMVETINWAIDEALKPEEKKEPSAVETFVSSFFTDDPLCNAIKELSDRLDRLEKK